jgi:PPP family 3-phenylpropionic acid transporter
MIGLGRLAMAPITSFFSLYVVEALHWNAVGLMWAISATSEIPFIFFSGPLIRRFGAPRLLAFSMVAISVRLALYALFPTPLGAVVGQTLHSLCFGLFHPAAVAFVATHVPPERRAVGMSLYLSLGVGLPTFLGSAVGGLVVDLGGYRLLFGSFITFALAGLALYGMIRHSLNAPAT